MTFEHTYRMITAVYQIFFTVHPRIAALIHSRYIIYYTLLKHSAGKRFRFNEAPQVLNNFFI